MNRQQIAIGIILSLGTLGCAGLGGPQASSLTQQVRQERGLDDLWMPVARPAAQGLEPPHYAGESLGTLWQQHQDSMSSPIADPAYFEKRSGGDLWNPASVVRSWEPRPRSEDDRASWDLFVRRSSARARADRAQPSVQ